MLHPATRRRGARRIVNLQVRALRPVNGMRDVRYMLEHCEIAHVSAIGRDGLNGMDRLMQPSAFQTDEMVEMVLYERLLNAGCWRSLEEAGVLISFVLIGLPVPSTGMVQLSLLPRSEFAKGDE